MNTNLARILTELGMFLEFSRTPFKPQAFQRAAEAIADLPEDVADIYRRGGRAALEALPHIGVGIAERIEEYITTGRIKEHARLQKKYPIRIVELMGIEGIGPATILKLYRTLHIQSREDLAQAVRDGALANVRGIGPRGQERIARAMHYQEKTRGRMLLNDAESLAHGLTETIASLPDVQHVVACGSLRRMQETVGDIDILVASNAPDAVLKACAALPAVEHVYSSGSTRMLVRLRTGRDADIAVVPEDSWGAGLIAWTGSKGHNVHLRTLAEQQGMLLNDIGLFRGKELIASRTEADVYATLGLQEIPPELRSDEGEIDAALKRELPDLVPYDAVRGDLQVQTDWSDGSASIEAMARAAQAAGLEYIAITDHTKSLTIANGLDERRLRAQWAEIDRVQALLPDIAILKGAEVDILKDGSLDLDDATLAELDVVGISVHSHFGLPKREQTKRICKAMEHRYADIVFHPTGRLIGRRAPYNIDIAALFDVAEKTGTIFEVNADPHRLDLRDEHIRMALERAIPLVIDSDAHAPEHFAYLRYGIAQARRGWARAADILNTLPLARVRERLKHRKT